MVPNRLVVCLVVSLFVGFGLTKDSVTQDPSQLVNSTLQTQFSNGSSNTPGITKQPNTGNGSSGTPGITKQPTSSNGNSSQPGLLQLLQELQPGIMQLLQPFLGNRNSSLPGIMQLLQPFLGNGNSSQPGIMQMIQPLLGNGNSSQPGNNPLTSLVSSLLGNGNSGNNPLMQLLQSLQGNSNQPGNNPMTGSGQNLMQFLPILQGNYSQIPTLLFSMLKDQISGNSQCSQDVKAFLTGLQGFEMWALQMFDSSGKLPKGILQGTLTFLGSYDDCIKINQVIAIPNSDGHQIQGAYAKISLSLPKSISALMSPGLAALGPSTLRWDLCMPKSCKKVNLTAALNIEQLKAMGVAVTSVDFVEVPSMKGDAGAIVTVFVYSMFGLLCLLGTLLDMVRARYTFHSKNKKSLGHTDNLGNGLVVTTISDKIPLNETNMVSVNGDVGIDNPAISLTSISVDSNHDGEPKKQNGEVKTNGVALSNGNLKHSDAKQTTPEIGKCTQILLTFSIIRNAKKILDCSTPSGTLSCLHGIRVLSMTWVLLGHFIMQLLGVVENKMDFFGRMGDFTFQIITNGTLSVDSFFLLSGLLVAYLFLREISKTGKVTGKQMALYYFHRYWRLTPLYMLVILFYTHLTKYLMDGPQVAKAVGEAATQNCKDYWWTNLLYINNLYKADSTEMCMAWSWYLANDMQFYVISPLALIPLALGYNVIGILVLLGLVASQIISTGYITWNIDFAGFLQQGAFGKFFEQVYVKPYSRVGVYAIGLILGFIIHKTKGKKKIPKLILVIGSIIAAVFGLLSTYLTYDNYKVNGHKWTHEYFMAQESLYRPAWAIAVAWMIYVCVKGYGGIVNSFLSWSAWIPLSRLTYGAYLVHLIILSAETESIRSFAYVDMYYMINGFMGTFALTFAVSFILALLIEAPCLGLEKVFIKK